jgi:hypothetical protein
MVKVSILMTWGRKVIVTVDVELHTKPRKILTHLMATWIYEYDVS